MAISFLASGQALRGVGRPRGVAVSLGRAGSSADALAAAAAARGLHSACTAAPAALQRCHLRSAQQSLAIHLPSAPTSAPPPQPPPSGLRTFSSSLPPLCPLSDPLPAAAQHGQTFFSTCVRRSSRPRTAAHEARRHARGTSVQPCRFPLVQLFFGAFTARCAARAGGCWFVRHPTDDSNHCPSPHGPHAGTIQLI